MEEKINSVIKSWTFFSKGLSFIGRVLVVNSQNCGILYRCCSLHKIKYRPFKGHSLILYGKVVIGLKVIYYIYVNHKAVWVLCIFHLDYMHLD